MEAYAVEHDLHIVRWFADEARPGSNDQRDAFQEMMRLAHADPAPIGVILLWSWSRFSRDQNDATYWKASLRRHGVDIRDVSGETPDVPGFEYVLESLIHWRDEQRLREISQDARRGQQALVRRGYVPSGGPPPRGFKVEFEEVEIEGRRRRVRRWVPDPHTWPLVDRAWRMRLQGRSYKDILRECPGLYKSPGCLRTFFSNTIYKGELWFGGTLIEVPAVVTAEEWAQVNRNRRKRHGGAYSRQQGSGYLLSGLVRCARCGSAVAGNRSGGGLRNDGYRREPWQHYICLRAKQGHCDLPRVGAAALEEAIIRALLDDVLTVQRLEQFRDELLVAQETERPALIARRDAVRRRVRELERILEELLVSLESSSSDVLVRRLEQREMERNAALEELALAEARLGDLTRSLPDVDVLREELERVLQEAPIAERRALVKRYVHEVFLDADEARVSYRLPFASTRIHSVPPRAL